MAKEMQRLKNRIIDMVFEKIETMERTGDEDGARLFVDNLRNFNDKISKAAADFACMAHFLRRVKKARAISEQREATLISVFSYLLVAEGQICNYLNLISYLLVTTGHDLYTLTKRKYVKDSIEEVRKVEMSTKMKFLKHHRFGALTKEYDSTFRNDIAHHNYEVDEKGILLVRGKSVDLGSKLDPLIRIAHFFIELFDELIEKLSEAIEENAQT